MFCSSCGGKLQEGVAFCSGCGAKVFESTSNKVIAPSEQPQTKPEQQQSKTVVVKDFKCNNCGASLKIPANTRVPVQCTFCKTECVIEGLIKNAEMAAKENINSGVPLTLSQVKIHKLIIEALSDDKYRPHDIFTETEVVREEHYCIPAYLFYCNGTASFTYEAGNIRQHKTAINLGDKTRLEKENYTEWSLMSSNVSDSLSMFISGNKETALQINELYKGYDPKHLVDYEFLQFPSDIETMSFDLPHLSAFNEYLRPQMEKHLKKKAEDLLEGKKYQKLVLGGNSTQTDDMVRVFLGVYRVVLMYEGNEYALLFTGDGVKTLCENLPIDEKRNIDYYKKIVELKLTNKPCKVLMFFANIILGFLVYQSIIAVFASSLRNDTSYHGILLFIILSSVLFLINILYVKKKKAYEAKRNKTENEINTLENKMLDAKNDFINKKIALKGIYKGVSGDENAF